MKTILKILALAVSAFGAKKGYDYFKKYRNIKKLSIGIDSFKLPKLNLKSLFGNIKASVTIGIKNFSESAYSLEQVKVDVFTLAGDLLGEQSTLLADSVSIVPNEHTAFSLDYSIPSVKLQELLQAQGGVAVVAMRFLDSGKYGIQLVLKGFIVSEGITIDINENITI
ncbi:MAG: hypothetical protein HRT72_12510 [Flavobacteriales bacterium]|nr:hypothetical protein [Flavobacteriales bacterium]